MAEPKERAAHQLAAQCQSNGVIKAELDGWRASHVDWHLQLVGLMREVPRNIQLQNLRHKLPHNSWVGLLRMDSTNLTFAPGTYDDVVVFLLLHEQPAEVRKQTLRQALRVVKPGGRLVVIEFSKPYWWSPFRYLWWAFLGVFEPFALGMWREEIAAMVPTAYRDKVRQNERFFGGLFQKVTIDLS